MLEHDIQQRFVDQVISPEVVSYPIKVYQELVYYRFFEVISNAYPIFYALVDKSLLEKNIYLFMQSLPKTEYIWKMADQWRKFVKKEQLFRELNAVDDLLLYEWVEVKLMMKAYKKHTADTFSWDETYHMSNSVFLMEQSYDILNAEYKTKGEFYILAYYDFAEHQVMYREINAFVFHFLHNIKGDSIEKKLNLFCMKHDVSVEEAKHTLEEALSTLVKVQVIRK